MALCKESWFLYYKNRFPSKKKYRIWSRDRAMKATFLCIRQDSLPLPGVALLTAGLWDKIHPRETSRISIEYYIETVLFRAEGIWPIREQSPDALLQPWAVPGLRGPEAGGVFPRPELRRAFGALSPVEIHCNALSEPTQTHLCEPIHELKKERGNSGTKTGREALRGLTSEGSSRVGLAAVALKTPRGVMGRRGPGLGPGPGTSGALPDVLVPKPGHFLEGTLYPRSKG